MVCMSVKELVPVGVRHAGPKRAALATAAGVCACAVLTALFDH